MATAHRYTTQNNPANDVPWMLFADDRADVERGYGHYHWVATTDGAIDVADIQGAIKTLFADKNPDLSDAEIAPPRIVESAGIWDDPDAVQAIWDNILEPLKTPICLSGVMKIKTPDGLIVMGIEDYDGNALVERGA